MNSPGTAPLPATVSIGDTTRPGRGPLGALPALSAAARRALVLTGLLALGNAVALVAQAFLLASVLASIVAGQTGDLATRLATLLAVVLARALVAWAMRVVAARAAAGAKEELRQRTVEHALRLGPEWVAARGPGELTALTTRGLDALDAYFTEYLPALVTAAVLPVGAGLAVLLADWPSAVIIALTLPLLPMFAILVGRYTADRVAGATEATHRLSGHLLELLRALPVLTAFRRAEAQAEAVRRVSERHRRAALGTLRIAFSSAFVLELAATLAVALVAVVIGVRLAGGDLSLAIGLGVLILAPECYQPLRAVGAAFHASADGIEAVRRVGAVIAEPLAPRGTARPGRGEVRVSGLRVLRRGGFAPDGESFTLRPGSTVWLRSPSGAGKSTTLAVLLGFATPADGTVTIDGIPLEEVDMSTWRESVAWLPQSPAFSGGTVRAELDLAAIRPPSAAERDEVLAALDLEHLAGEQVDRLSTGQRQRVGLARALLRARQGAWLLLLDEPTAHLDAEQARLAMSAIAAARRRGAAVLIAAHTRSSAEQPPAPTPVASGDPEAVTLAPRAAIAPATNTRPRLRELLDRRFLAGAALGAAGLLAGVALTATSGWLIAKASQQPPILTLTVAVVGVRTFGLARAGLRYAERLATHDGAFRIAGRLRVRLWQALVRLGPARTLSLRRGEGQRRLVEDVDTVRDLLPRVLTPPLVVAVVLAGAAALHMVLLPAAGLVLLGALLLGALLAPLLALRVERRASATLAGGRREVTGRVLALFDTAAELIAFGAAANRRAELAAADARLAGLARRQALGAGIAQAVVVLSTGTAAVACTWLAGRAVAAGTLDPVLAPALALVPLAVAEALALLPPAVQHLDTLRNAHARLRDCCEWATHSGFRSEHSGASASPLGRWWETGGRATHSSGGVELRGVRVRWPGADGAALREVDLRVPRGSTAAVVGPSGAGKSTLLATMVGLLQPERGHASLPATVAWAPQEPQLVSTTVAENLKLADPHATEAELAAALATAGLPDLPLDTVLGSAGAGLSGGQAQRVGLARALLAAKDADLVLLDEPTAHLDAAAADRLRANLRTALAGKTVIQVTHRPEEAAEADLVIQVDRGRAGQAH
ncbi:thiol reductant ABC exporter subunit CydD [Amycolatopsis aidingensis]|uniref:thiol reductant ABC exporter subunit CydD n=1 Tax=Amycolatopsis aidingensis TaxID=2842453 RepID=UPI001C0D52F3|nr:thiol reductant ABC exporter subunit CydD [Amycolatopsis aidingensis]